MQLFQERKSNSLTKSFDKNLSNKNSETSTTLSIKGKRIACSFDMVSCATTNTSIAENQTNKWTHLFYHIRYLKQKMRKETKNINDQFVFTYIRRFRLHWTIETNIHSKAWCQDYIQVWIHLYNKRCQW